MHFCYLVILFYHLKQGDMVMIILHVVRKPEWERQRGHDYYLAASLDEVGFIHCAALKDVVDVSNCYYSGIRDMVLLCIDTAMVEAEIKWETSEWGVAYPHLHGPLNQNAVVEVIEFPVDADGRFIFPAALNKYSEQK